MNRRGIFTSMALAVGACTVSLASAPAPAGAVASLTVARYEMNEASGATTLVDTSGNNLNGTIGSEVTTNTTFGGSVGHTFAYLAPDTPPAHPGHLDKVPDNTLLDAGTSDYAVTVRYRTTRSFGNLIQKGQNAAVGGYFKIELPNGFVTCLFKGSKGEQRAVISPNSVKDGQWHTIRCERLAAAVSLYIDGVRVGRLAGSTGSISNVNNLSIGGKSDCDQVTVTCDYFVGDIDYVQIEKGAGVANTPPVAAFTQNCVDLTCTFNGSTSTDPGGSIITYAWNFGDGTTGSGPTPPAHTYMTAGSKNVSLTVTDNGSLTNTSSHPVIVTAPINTPPTAAFTFTCATFDCSFNAGTSTDAQGPIASYTWDFGDMTTPVVTTTPTTNHLYAGDGTYTVKLTVTDSGLLTDDESHDVVLLPDTAPTASFTVNCANLTCTFDASASSDANGPIASYSWDFGDMGTGTGVNPTHPYSANGDYPVVLTVTDGTMNTGTADGTASAQPVVSNISYVGATQASANATSFATNIPATVQAGDALLLFLSTGTNPTIGQPTGVTGWTAVDTLTNTNGTTRVWKKVATATDANKRITITSSATAKGNIMIAAYRGTSATDPIASFARTLQTNNTANRTTPQATVANSASWGVSYWMHRDSSSTALTAPGTVTSRSAGNQSGGGRVTTLLADSAGPVNVTTTYGGQTATANAASTLGTVWTIILAPA